MSELKGGSTSSSQEQEQPVVGSPFPIIVAYCWPPSSSCRPRWPSRTCRSVKGGRIIVVLVFDTIVFDPVVAFNGVVVQFDQLAYYFVPSTNTAM